MGSQVGYGHSDAADAVPFDYYVGTAAATTETIQMSTGSLVLDGTAITSGALTINLPINPIDGQIAEIRSVLGVTSGNTLVVQVAATDTVCAKTGVSGVKGSTAPTAILAAGVAGTTVAAIRYQFTLFGDILTQSAANTPASPSLPATAPTGTNNGYWIRVQ